MKNQQTLPDGRTHALEERAVLLGTYIAEHGATVRAAAKVFGISKSTVHKDVTVRLPQLHAGLAEDVRAVIETNKQERHIRGGLATKRKYAQRKKTAPASGTDGKSTGYPHSFLCKFP